STCPAAALPTDYHDLTPATMTGWASDVSDKTRSAQPRRPRVDCQTFPCSLQQFKTIFELPNCHSGAMWLELNHNNEKKRQPHGKDATDNPGPRRQHQNTGWRRRDR